MKRIFPFAKKRSKTPWEIVGGFIVVVAGVALIERHWSHVQRYLSGGHNGKDSQHSGLFY